MYEIKKQNLNNRHLTPHNKILRCLYSITLAMMLTSCTTVKQQALANTYCNTEKTTQNAPFKYSYCAIKNSKNDVKKLSFYWWNTDAKKPFYTFKNLKNKLNKHNKNLIFAVNAGMYDKQFAPLAYYVENFHQQKAINLKQGKGNFHLMPNGIFWIDKNNVGQVTETKKFNTQILPKNTPKFATQSGPMLVIDGKIHPKFLADSTSKKIRNGVGVCDNLPKRKSASKTKQSITHNNASKSKHLVFVTSDSLVNFYEFARFFKEDLNCKNALFLDGGIASAMYSSELNRRDRKYMGVMIGFYQLK